MNSTLFLELPLKLLLPLQSKALIVRSVSSLFLLSTAMMKQDKFEDDEEMNGAHSSSTVGARVEKSEMPEIPLCGCLSVRFYQPYFDIDSSDVISRLSNALFYCKREQNFLSRMRDKPDAYGPFWIATTLVFTVGFSSHINSWLSSWMHGKIWYVANRVSI